MTESTLLELRRGAIILAVLSQLGEAHYGYSLRQHLAEIGFDINEGTLYPLLRRLESQGLLESSWDDGDGRRRRYYRISPAGKEVLGALIHEWRALVEVMNRALIDFE